VAKKIKVLVDGHVFDGIFQGSRTFLKGLYAKLSESDSLDIYIAANDLNNLEREFSGINGTINFVRLKSKSKIKRLLVDLPALVSKYKFDYVHYQYMDSPIKLCKSIITIHDVLFLEFVDDFSWLYQQKKYLFALAAYRSSILTTDSEYSRIAINKYLNVPLNKIHIVQPALDDDFIIPLSKRVAIASKKNIERKFKLNKYILYVSRVEPRKNHEILLRAYLEMKLWESGYHLIFVGKNSINSPKLNFLFDAMTENQQQYVSHYESVPHNELLDLLRSASIFVCPSKAEGFGYPPLEAGAFGVETLISNATCLSEFDFFGDRFFDPNDLDDLKNKILNIISGDNVLPSMKGISNTIRTNFNWDRTAYTMERLIVNDFKIN